MRVLLCIISIESLANDSAHVNVNEVLRRISPQLFNSLLPFQQEGVLFGIRKHGRVLIGDEMGSISAVFYSCLYAVEVWARPFRLSHLLCTIVKIGPC